MNTMTTNALHIHLATNSERQIWDDYVLSHERGVAYQLFAWKEAVESAYGFECPYFIALENDIVCGVLPLAKIHLPFCKGGLVSLPYCDAGGILADDEETENALLAEAIKVSKILKVNNIELRHIKPLSWMREDSRKNPVYNAINSINTTNLYPVKFFEKNSKANLAGAINWTTKSSKVRMLLPLLIDAESLLSNFKSKLRSQVRKPKKDGLIAKVGGIELLDDFYSLFVETMRDLGSPVHSKTWFISVFEVYLSRAKCCVVYMPDGEPAAGGVLLLHSRIVSNPWSSSLRRFNRWNPNMLLYWTFLEYAANQGYAFFDFGRSTPGEGTYRFKEQWGAKPEPLFWYTISLNGSPVKKQTIDKSKFDKAIQYWKKLPIPVTKVIGPRIRKYISL
jgi:FemAB-related protein (PEP-CTERM system-associated)